MSWLFSRALVEAYSEENSLAGEPFVPLNGNPIPQAYCAPDRMTKFSRLSRFGMTYAPLTESRGEELCKLYREDFLARTSVLPDTAQVSPAADQDSGLKWQGLLGKYDHATRLWKTAQCSLLADLEQSLEIWPRWGLMRSGVSYQQQTLVHHTSESESGLWGTPTTSQDYKPVRKLLPSEADVTHGTILVGSIGKEHPHLIGKYLKPLVTEWLMGWPLEWTDLKPLETDKFQEWQQQHGGY